MNSAQKVEDLQAQCDTAHARIAELEKGLDDVVAFASRQAQSHRETVLKCFDPHEVDRSMAMAEAFDQVTGYLCALLAEVKR